MKNLLWSLSLILTFVFGCNLEQSNTDVVSTGDEIAEDSVTTVQEVLNTVDPAERIKIRNLLPLNVPPPDYFEWWKWEEPISVQRKLGYFSKVMESEYFTVNQLTSQADYEFKNYHIIDFNNDGYLDVVYAGRNPNGIETNNLAFFLNHGDTSIILTVKLNGDIVKMARPSKNEPIVFQVSTAPCCGNKIHTLKNIAFSTAGNCYMPYFEDDAKYKKTYAKYNHPDFCMRIIETYSYVVGTKFPKLLARHDTIVNTQNQALFFNAGENKTYKSTGAKNDEAICLIPANSKLEVLSTVNRTQGQYQFVKVVDWGKGNLNESLAVSGLCGWLHLNQE